MPSRYSFGPLGSFLILGLGLLALPACSSGTPDPRKDLAYGQSVRGRITYNGKPVPYGFVVFYSHGKSTDPTKGLLTPTAVGPIVEGRYEVANAPVGHAAICVRTDPDLDPGALTSPVKPGEKGTPDAKPDQPGLPPGFPGGKGGMPGGQPKPPPPPPSVEPGAGGKQPMMKLPPKMKAIPGPGNPATMKFSEAQKAELREIHERFGEFGKSPLAYMVKEGDNTFDIILHR